MILHMLHDELRIDEVIAGKARLGLAGAMRLYHEASLHDLGRWSTAMCQAKHGSEIRTYIIDRNINYTNVCSARCTFCAFRRDEGESDAYVLDRDALHQKIQELVDIGGTQILLQGGMHPGLDLDWYIDMLSGIKQAFPTVHVHGFSPPEVIEFAAVLPVDGFPTPGMGKAHEMDRDTLLAKLRVILGTLKEAGLDSLPGGGGEIFTEHVRRRIGIGKATAEQWLDVMSVAHELGMHTSATMMFGHIEGIADRFDHMLRVRERQDLAIENDWAGCYVSFIAWPFQRENTPLGRVPNWDRLSDEPFPGDVLADLVANGEVDGHHKAACDQAVPRAGKVVRMAGASEYLRMQAISRLMMDNIHSIGSSWVTMGPRVGQTALMFGASDMGSVMMEENVVSAAGTTYCLTEPVLCHLIRDAGFTPAQRDNSYNLIKTHDNDQSPDLQVNDWSSQRAASLHQESAVSSEPVALTISGTEQND